MESVTIKSDALPPDTAKVPEGATATPSADPNGVSKASVPSDPPKKDEAPAEKLLAGKYKNAEELEKGYLELQKTMGKPKVEAKPVTEESVKAAGLDLAALTKEVADAGGDEIPTTVKAKLNAAGFSDEDINGYVAGQRALADAIVNDISTVVGGKENLTNVLSWAKTALTEPEKKAYNDALRSGNNEGAKMYMKGILSKYEAAMGKDGKRVTGEPSGTGDTVGFASNAEMVKAMSDPRYKNDPAYIKKVEQRVKATR